MSQRVWLLVEWVDEDNVFPSYGVLHIDIDTFSYKESDLQPGKVIFISLKNKDPSRAKVIRVSDNKHQVKEHKDFLERQDQQMKNVLQLCMRTLNEMKSGQYSSSMENRLPNPQSIMGQQMNMPHPVINARSENSASDSDAEVEQQGQHRKMTKYNQTHLQNVRYEPNMFRKKVPRHDVTMSQRRRSVISSTPLPGKSVQENNIKLCFDQGTQTDNAWSLPPMAKIEEIELVLKHLYGRFQSLVMRVNGAATLTNGTTEMLELEQNCEVSYVEPNDSWASTGNVVQNSGMDSHVGDENVAMDHVIAEQITEAENNQSENVEVTVKVETSRKHSNESSRVRRMSAQTTYSNEMVPIGNGHATVPARLLNDIDWTSYTTATRQLLQAIFPRKVLATHSLTGKRSPAHLNKPAKKLLNPYLVEDIILTVSTKSGVPQNLVRNTITVKCTDEAKLYRNRQRNRFFRTEKNQNNENVPPSVTNSSDDS